MVASRDLSCGEHGNSVDFAVVRRRIPIPERYDSDPQGSHSSGNLPAQPGSGIHDRIALPCEHVIKDGVPTIELQKPLVWIVLKQRYQSLTGPETDRDGPPGVSVGHGAVTIRSRGRDVSPRRATSIDDQIGAGHV